MPGADGQSRLDVHARVEHDAIHKGLGHVLQGGRVQHAFHDVILPGSQAAILALDEHFVYCVLQNEI